MLLFVVKEGRFGFLNLAFGNFVDNNQNEKLKN